MWEWVICYYNWGKDSWYKESENEYIELSNLCISDVFYVVKYCVEEYNIYIDDDFYVDVYFKEVREYYIYIMYLISYISEGDKDGIEYCNYVCGFWVVMFVNEIWYGELIKFMKVRC